EFSGGEADERERPARARAAVGLRLERFDAVAVLTRLELAIPRSHAPRHLVEPDLGGVALLDEQVARAVENQETRFNGHRRDARLLRELVRRHCPVDF